MPASSAANGQLTTPSLRVALGDDGVSIWSAEIFGGPGASRVRDFLSRAFAIEEVDGVELRRSTSFGRIRYRAAANPAAIWRKLSRALGATENGTPSSTTPVPKIDAAVVYLDAPGETLRIARVGNVLSTWRVRRLSSNTLRLSHPALRNRSDIVFRLEEELASILGVEDFSASALTAGVSIRFDSRTTTAERVTRELEKAWPRLLEGLDGPPSRARFAAAVGLLGLSFAGQYLAPAARPFAVAGVTLYSLPNVVKGAKELTRGEVGVSALYSTGLGFMLFSGLPFTASVMATLMQLWPHLARRKLVSSQRRLFAGQRRRPAWARIPGADGGDIEVSVDHLRAGDLIIARSGELIPVDGVVEQGSGVIVDDTPFARKRVEGRSHGDAVTAGTHVRDGNLTIRVERAGAQTAASYVASLLPHTPLVGLPSSLDAERIANRNAKPALALSALILLLTRTLRPAQAVIRPDYATAPRLSAQLSTLQSIAHGLQEGVLFKNPAALDRLSRADTYVFDDSVGLDRRRLGVIRTRVVAALKAHHPTTRVVYVSRAQPTQARALARKLGFDAAHGGLSQAAKVDIIRGLGNVVWIGDGSAPEAKELIAASSVSISVAPLSRFREDNADILVPHERLSSVPELVAIARAHAGRLAKDYRTVYWVNLLGVGGAFLASFTSLHAGLLSNVGTGVIYARHARALDRLASTAEKKRAQAPVTATRSTG